VVLWWTRVRLRTELDREARRTVILCYRQLVLRQMNEQLVAEKICGANYTGEKADHVSYIYLSPDRFSKIDQFHSIADKMGDVFVESNLPRPERANNRRVDGWRLCYTLLDTDGVAVLDNCPDVIDSIPKLMRDEKNIEDAAKEGNELYLDVCESFRYGLMSYANAEEIPAEVRYQREIQKISSNSQKYIRYLELQAKAQHSDAIFTIDRRRRR
jgi:hypothetical protein